MREQNLPGLDDELGWAVLVRRVRQQQRHQHRATGRQRTPGPPEVQRAGMAVPDRLLARGVFRHHGDRKVDLS